jgi:hypothetical protein
MTVRGGGVPLSPHGFNAVKKNGSAASELAADAYHCIMVRVFAPTAYKDVARTFVHHARAPLDPSSSRRHNKRAVVLGTFKAKPYGGRRYPLLRRRRVEVWVGAKKRLAVEQRNSEGRENG